MSFSIRKIGMLEMPKIAMLSTILYGRGTLLSIDEKAPRTEEDETTSSSSEATQ
jgi:hypothetical protein